MSAVSLVTNGVGDILLVFIMNASTYKAKHNISRHDAVSLLRTCPFREVNAVVATMHGYHSVVILHAVADNPGLLTRKQVLKLILSALFGTPDMRLTLVVTALDLALRTGCDAQLRASVTKLWPRLDADRATGYLVATSYWINSNGAVTDRELADPEPWMAQLPELFALNPAPDIRTQLLFQVEGIARNLRKPQARQWARDWVQQMPGRPEDYREMFRYQFVKKLKARRKKKTQATRSKTLSII